MAPRTSPKGRNTNNGAEAKSPTRRRSGEQAAAAETTQRKSPTRRSLEKSSPKHSSINDRLVQAREFLHSEDPSTTPIFATEYRAIRSSIDDLASAKVIFDINVYNDVKAMLRVHGERLREPQPILPLTRTVGLSSSSSPSKVFTDDLAYEGPSSASTTTSQKSKTHESDEDREHPWQEGEVLIFEPRPFGPKAPGYSHPAPTEVMGFDPELGFVRRNIRSSEEIFPSAKGAKERVLDKGFAQLDFSKKDGARRKGAEKMEKSQAEKETVTVTTKPRAKKEATKDKSLTKGKRKVDEAVDPDIVSDRVSLSKTSPTKGKDVVEEVPYPRIASNSTSLAKPKVSPTKAMHQSKKIIPFLSPKKQTCVNPSLSTPAARLSEGEYDDPITLSNKRVRFEKDAPELIANEIIHDHLLGSDSARDKTAYSADDIEMKRLFEAGQQVNEEASVTGNEENELPMQIEELVENSPTDLEDDSEKGFSVPAHVNKEQGKTAIVAESKDERTRVSGLSGFATKFLHLWRAKPKPMQEGRQRLRPEHVESPVSAFGDNQLIDAEFRHRNRSPAGEGCKDGSPGEEESYEEDCLDENAAFVPPAMQPSPSSLKPLNSNFLKEIEEEEARHWETKKTEAKARKTDQATPYGSHLPELAIVPPTPPTPKSFQEMQREVVSEARTEKPKAKFSHKKQPTFNSSTLPVPVALPPSPPPSKSPDETPGVGAKETGATLAKAASKYFAAEEALSKGRRQREAMMKEAKAIYLQEKAKATESREKMQKAEISRTASRLAPGSRLPTPPMSSPTPDTHSSSDLAVENSTSSSTGPYGHFGLIPPEIAKAPITYPSPSSSTKRLRRKVPEDIEKDIESVNKHTKREVKFWPGDPVFLFGETRYLTALKSRQIEKDLASNNKDVQTEIDNRPLMGMFARYRLPDPPAGWNGVAREKQAINEKVVEGRVQKKKRPKRGKSGLSCK
ncbi:MAG: hypothetical protein Q9209_001513 [Squamulea sp. 1 TL-2023]